MRAKSFAAVNQIIIDHNQIAEPQMRGVVVLAKAKAMRGSQPAKIGLATRVGGTFGKSQRITLVGLYSHLAVPLAIHFIHLGRGGCIAASLLRLK
jgi:hypothetical protein